MLDQATNANTTLHDLEVDIATKYQVNPKTLANLVESESEWNPNAVGDHGCSLGLVQINTCARKVNKVDALDPTFALIYAAKALANGTEDAWSSCNCYGYVSTLTDLPHMAAIVPQSFTPKPGSVAVFYYHDKETGVLIKHIAYVRSVADGNVTILEANKTHCLVDTRTIPMTDPALAGFWVG